MNQQDFEFMKTFVGVLVALGLSAVVFFFIAGSVSEDNIAILPDSAEYVAVEERIQPVGTVVVAGGESADAAPAADAGAAAVDVATLVGTACAACHGSGVMGAPRVGTKADWEARVAAGIDSVVSNAINGKGAMPAKGGDASLSDETVRAAVLHMLKESGFDTGEAAAAPAAETATASAGPDAAAGKGVYGSACAACHSTGAAGAPKVGDAADWAARSEKGMDAMIANAVNGFTGSKGVMPPKGGRAGLSDADVANAVAHMVAESK